MCYNNKNDKYQIINVEVGYGNFLWSYFLYFLGIAMIAKPEAFLYFQDIFRLKGERTYSEVAIIIQRLAGVLAIILGIVFMFIGF